MEEILFGIPKTNLVVLAACNCKQERQTEEEEPLSLGGWMDSERRGNETDRRRRPGTG